MAGQRPLSPHLGIWKWRVTALISIFHRATGNALAVAGILAFTWWLVAAASGPEAYALFASVAGSPIGWIVWIGLTWSLFQHLMSGIRHLLMDAGWGFELVLARNSASFVFVGAVVLTALFWAMFLMVGPGTI